MYSIVYTGTYMRVCDYIIIRRYVYEAYEHICKEVFCSASRFGTGNYPKLGAHCETQRFNYKANYTVS